MATATQIKNVEARYSDPTGVIFVPWTDGNHIGTVGYDVFSIVGDTFSVTQDDPDTTEIPHEFSDTPLDENTTLGKATLTMQCLDFDDNILEKLFGCTKTNVGTQQDPEYVISFPAEYKDLYCLVQLEFKDKVVVFPKVKMNSKAVFENLRSDIARGELSGTLYNTYVKLGSDIVDTPRIHMPAGTTYTVGGTVSGSTMSGGATIIVKDGTTATDISANA